MEVGKIYLTYPVNAGNVTKWVTLYEIFVPKNDLICSLESTKDLVQEKHNNTEAKTLIEITNEDIELMKSKKKYYLETFGEHEYYNSLHLIENVKKAYVDYPKGIVNYFQLG